MAILQQGVLSSSLTLSNNLSQGLHWADLDLIKGNVSAPILYGDCSDDVAQIVLQISSFSVSRIMNSKCVGGKYRFHLNNENLLTSNEVYTFSISSTDKDGRLLTGPLAKTYDYFKHDLSTELVVTSPSDSISATPASEIDFSGLCSSSNISFSLKISRNSWNQSVNCNQGDAWNFYNIPLALGTNTVLLEWNDVYGNSASLEYIVNRGELLLVGGMMSATEAGLILPLGEVHSGDPAAPCDGTGKACLYWSSITPLAPPDSSVLVTEGPYLSHESDPSGESWLSVGILGRLFNLLD
jgi:hypothetical protein